MSFRDPFEVLGIERTGATVRDVKRAYALRLKSTRPDEDPKGFMELRSALENATQQIVWDEEDARYEAEHAAQEAKEASEDASTDEHVIGEETPAKPTDSLTTEPPSHIQTEPDDHHSEFDAQPPEYEATETDEAFTSDRKAREDAAWREPPSELDTVETDHEPDQTEPKTVDIPPPNDNTYDQAALDQHFDDLYAAVDAAYDQLEALLKDKDKRGDWDNWLAIIDSESVEDVEAFQMLSYRIRGLVSQLTGFDHESTAPKKVDELTPDIILKLDDRYGWSRQSSQDWFERNENTWIRRVVEDAEDATGRSRNGAWGKAPRRKIEKVDSGSGDTSENQNNGFSDGTNVLLSFLWLIVRLVAVFAAIRLIGGLFD